MGGNAIMPVVPESDRRIVEAKAAPRELCVALLAEGTVASPRLEVGKAQSAHSV